MTVVFLMVSLVVAIAFETILAGLPLHLVSLLNPSSWVAWGSLLFLLGWCFGE
jgi:hypothetical protein